MPVVTQALVGGANLTPGGDRSVVQYACGWRLESVSDLRFDMIED
jgi:hypothetical protein